MKIVKIYTDGGCSGNQNDENLGGWGAVLEYNGHQKEMHGGAINTTNNIMEMTAVIEGLKSLKSKDLDIHVYSDSAYVVNCFKQKWYVKWQSNGWKNSKKEPVENKELWVELIDLVNSFHSVNFHKVKGHLNLDKKAEMKKWYDKFQKNNYPIDMEGFIYLTKMNILADELANRGIDALR